MTFREALQSEINLQGLSVAQIAKDSKLSKGAIYNILNGTTEDARIRPSTRKALATACNREILQDSTGVQFDVPGEQPAIIQASDVSVSSTVVSWLPNRPFLTDRHAGPVFDWLHRMEERGELEELGVVDRVYQNRPDFLSLSILNRGERSIGSIRGEIEVRYDNGPTEQFLLHLAGPVEPGLSAEETVFVCVGTAFQVTMTRAEQADASGVSALTIPDTFRFSGGRGD